MEKRIRRSIVTNRISIGAWCGGVIALAVTVDSWLARFDIAMAALTGLGIGVALGRSHELHKRMRQPLPEPEIHVTISPIQPPLPPNPKEKQNGHNLPPG